MFSFTPKSEQGGVPAYGDLTGLSGLDPGRRLELLPYAVGNGRVCRRPRRGPAGGRRELDMNGGLDARYRVTSNLTLAATANPDFGQVEVDPAVINLTAFETRYQERRPFFVEGATSFRFGGAVGGPSARGGRCALFASHRPRAAARASALTAPTCLRRPPFSAP